MKYNKCKFKKLKFFNQNINKEDIIKILKSCYLNNSFSTFPYICNNCNSENAITKYNSANCIGLSIYIKKMLKEKYNVKSFLIPSTIPNKYKVDNYLDLAHVVVACPINKNECYIIDTAFYFLEPLLFNKKESNNNNIKSSNIYNNNIDIIESNNNKTIIKEVLNDYQIIPKNTYFVECNYIFDKKDTWNYYLIEILNPDCAISDFFINIRNKPFITSTIFNANNSLILELYIKFIDNNNVKISLFNNEIFNGNPINLSFFEETILNPITYKYFKKNIKDYLSNIKLLDE